MQLNIRTYDRLDFQTKDYMDSGTQALVKFDNGFGASIIQDGRAYGGLELAVLSNFAKGTWEITYSTNITNDVEGYLIPDDVTDLLQRIATLSKDGIEPVEPSN